MTQDTVLKWLALQWPGPQVNATSWAFGFGQALHFMGLCLLFGVMLIVDLRLLGVFKRLPLKPILGLLPLAVIGFVFLVGSGWEFVTTNPKLYWTNPAFRMKMYLILIAGLNALYFTFYEHHHASLVGANGETSSTTKITAAFSIILWTSILLFGRLLQQFTVSVN